MKKKVLAAVLAATMVLNVLLGLCIQAEEPYDQYGFDADASGIARYQPAIDSDEDGVYEIGNAGQMYWFAEKLRTVTKKDYDAVLTSDIEMTEGVPEGLLWRPIGATGLYYNTETITEFGYIGTFDGQNHKISNFKLDNSSVAANVLAIGFFGSLGGTVKRMIFDGANISGFARDGRYGAVCAQVLTGGVLQDCLVKNSTINLNGQYVAGGVAGSNYGGTVKNCLTINTSTSATRMGQIVGDNRNDNSTLIGNIENCFTDGSGVTSSQEGTVTKSEVSISSERMKSGEIGYRLNGFRNPNVWGQNVTDITALDMHPVLGGVALTKVTETLYTNGEVNEEELLAAAKTEAIERLENYKNPDDYRLEQQNELSKAIEEGRNAINALTAVADIDSELGKAKDVIDAIKTNEELVLEDWETSGKHNLVKNGDFNYGMKCWEARGVSGGCAIIGDKLGMQKCLRIGKGGGQVVQTVSVRPNSMYKFSYRINCADGYPQMGVYSYNSITKNTISILAGNNWNTIAGEVATRTYDVANSSTGRCELFSGQGDVLIICLNASGSANVYIDDIQLIGAKPDDNAEFTNMNNNMLADKQWVFGPENTTHIEETEYKGRKMLHLKREENENGEQTEALSVLKWTKVTPGRTYIAGGFKASTQLNSIALCTTDADGKIISQLGDNNWAHEDIRTWVMGQGVIDNRNRAYTVPPEGVYGLAVVGYCGAWNSDAWYSDFFVYDVTESYEFTSEQTPTLVKPGGADFSILGNTIKIEVDNEESNIEIASSDGSKVEYYSDQWCTDVIEPNFTNLEEGTFRSFYAKVYCMGNAKARVYKVFVTNGVDGIPDETPTPEPSIETIVETPTPIIPSETPKEVETSTPDTVTPTPNAGDTTPNAGDTTPNATIDAETIPESTVTANVTTTPDLVKPTKGTGTEPTPAAPGVSATPAATTTPSNTPKADESDKTDRSDKKAPGRVMKLSVKKIKARKIKVTWKAVNGAKRYKVIYAKNKKFKGFRTKWTKKKSIVFPVPKWSRLFVKVRAYNKAKVGSKRFSVVKVLKI